MNCEQSRPLIDPYADGELDTSSVIEMERHLRSCPACSLELRNLQMLKNAIKQDALYFTAPPELKRNLVRELRIQTETDPARNLWNWLSFATIGAAIVCLAILLTITFNRPSDQERLAQELVSCHVRSLITNHAMDVASSDKHTVKPWFAGKLNFSPPVEDLSAQGFPLIGGRLDYVDGHTVAALVYQRHKHFINLFIWPSKETGSSEIPLPSIQGFNLIHWSAGGMTFWAISDVNVKELLEFSKTWAEAK